MPLITYLCECKNSKTKYFRMVKNVPSLIICENCQKNMKKQLSESSSSSKIIIDNGHMARALEISPDIVEINQARANKNYSED